jgi:hypothetical protein
MPRPGVIDRDARADLQANVQQPILLREEGLVPTAEQGVDLARGQFNAPLRQLLAQ